MVSDGAPELMTPVLAGDGSVIHLALARSPGLPAATTLCHEPTGGPVSAQHFHRLGCPRCVQEAVDRGVVSIEDLHHATVNLSRFVAAQRARECRDPARAAPGQRRA